MLVSLLAQQGLCQSRDQAETLPSQPSLAQARRGTEPARPLLPTIDDLHHSKPYEDMLNPHNGHLRHSQLKDEQPRVQILRSHLR